MNSVQARTHFQIACKSSEWNLTMAMKITLSTQQARADSRLKKFNDFKKYVIWLLNLESPLEMHSNKYKHA